MKVKINIDIRNYEIEKTSLAFNADARSLAATNKAWIRYDVYGRILYKTDPYFFVVSVGAVLLLPLEFNLFNTSFVISSAGLPMSICPPFT